MSIHHLYSYRRCPYAMRARMALYQAEIQCDVHEISFKDKPAEMLEASPKGTVPVLILDNGKVLDESLDIMKWALGQYDPEGWMTTEGLDLIAENDGVFKGALDRYKYPNRFLDEDCSNAREQGLAFLIMLNKRLEDNAQLCGATVTIADIAIFPFIRQFAHVDKDWFDAQKIGALHTWLHGHLNSVIFEHVFRKPKENPQLLIY